MYVKTLVVSQNDFRTRSLDICVVWHFCLTFNISSVNTAKLGTDSQLVIIMGGRVGKVGRQASPDVKLINIFETSCGEEDPFDRVVFYLQSAGERLLQDAVYEVYGSQDARIIWLLMLMQATSIDKN